MSKFRVWVLRLLQVWLMLFLLRVFDSCDFLWILFCRAFEYFAFTLVAILSESDGDSQSLEVWLLRFIEFMSIDCDSLTSLLLSTLFVSWSETWVEVRDVSFVISCCASGTDNGWSWFLYNSIMTAWNWNLVYLNWQQGFTRFIVRDMFI